eukprot:TRINITY_DN111433_c0_g1_i1.p1 TRINITY_DN111433_c0_g1~~TRINITY_DN111433_c0_g1_i1.p1  ORF type:complete len:149 (-),score=40.40 TRINITY_DN111433_c0_g1_i1:60-506(-)
MAVVSSSAVARSRLLARRLVASFACRATGQREAACALMFKTTTAHRSFCSVDKALLIARKKMKHQARTREDSLLADYLLGFAEAKSESFGNEEIAQWQKLMDCDDELLMNLVAGFEEVPEELDSTALQAMREYLSAQGPRDPFKARWE